MRIERLDDLIENALLIKAYEVYSNQYDTEDRELFIQRKKVELVNKLVEDISDED